MHITVSIPVFNRANLVGRTIESILNQGFGDFDVLVVDDASSNISWATADRRVWGVFWSWTSRAVGLI